jgi:hypothetical protein
MVRWLPDILSAADLAVLAADQLQILIRHTDGGVKAGICSAATETMHLERRGSIDLIEQWGARFLAENGSQKRMCR